MTRRSPALVLAALAVVGCSPAQPQPVRESAMEIVPPPAATPTASAAAVPSAAPSAVPTAAPTAAASVDREHCHPHPPALSFEVKDDDVVIPLDAKGCPLGESHFKPNGYSYKASVEFMTEIQKRAQAGDKAGLAEMVNYPLRVNTGKPPAHLDIKDRAAFLRQFDRIFTPALITALLRADPRDVFCRDVGIAVGDGLLWADNGKGDHYGVTAVNPPSAPRGSSPP